MPCSGPDSFENRPNIRVIFLPAASVKPNLINRLAAVKKGSRDGISTPVQRASPRRAPSAAAAER